MSHVLQVEEIDALTADGVHFVENYDSDDYCGDLALFLADRINVSYVLNGHLLPDNSNKIRTVTLVAKGKLVSNMTYPLYVQFQTRNGLS